MKKHLRHIAQLTLCLFLLNVAVSALASFSASHTDERILVCTSQGYQWISLAELTQAADTAGNTPVPLDLHDCPLCSVQDDYDITLPSSGFYTSTSWLTISRSAITNSPVVDHSHFRQHSPRAPPRV